MSQNDDSKKANDGLQEQLRYLNLLFIRENLEDLASQAAQNQWTHVDFLSRLIEGEAGLRRDRAIQRRIQQARFPVVKTLDAFDFNWPSKVNRAQIQNLFRLKFVEDRANLIFIGNTGLGKSHLSIALGYAACLAGRSVLFTTAIDIVNNLSAAQNAGRFVLELKKYLRPELVLVDELGYLPIDKRGADLLFQVISHRPCATHGPTRDAGETVSPCWRGVDQSESDHLKTLSWTRWAGLRGMFNYAVRIFDR